MPPNTQDALGVDGMSRCELKATRGRAARGFTLIELMIAVAIVAILIAVALPSYRDYVLRGQLTDARNLLSTTAAQLEQFYQDNRHYGSTASTCGVTLPTSTRFTFSCNWGASGTNNQTFTLTATGTGSTSGFTFTISQDRIPRTTAVPSAAWGTVPTTCWVMAKGGQCA
jgi:type IV pilus assembly protein PilE